MAVLVRVKRKRDELPSERLILAAPRAKRERSARELLRSTFQGLGLHQPPPTPEQNLPVERRCFRRLDTLDAAAARDLEERTRGETAQRLLREALRLRRKRRPSPEHNEEASPTTTQSSPKRRQRPPQQAICVDLKDGALERSSPVPFEKSSEKKCSRSLTDLTAFAGVERSPTNSSLDMLAPGGARETARDENSERRRLAAAVSTAMASEDPASLVELRAACGTPLAISLVCRDGATPLMAFARHGCQDDVARLVALGADSRRVDARGRDAAMHAHARGHAAVRDRLLAAAPPKPPTRTASEVHPKRSFLDGVSAYYEDDQDVSHGDDAEMVGLPLDDFVYDVYAYDATADVEPRRVSTSRDHDGAQSLPDDLSRTVDCESLASRAMTPGGDTLSSSGESEDDDGLSTRCVVSPRRRSRAAPLVVGIRHPLRDVLALPRTNEDDPAGTDGDDDVSSLGADDNDRNKSADDRSLSNGSLEDDDRSFRSHPMTAWDSSPPFFSLGNGNGPPAAAFPSHSRDDASL